MDVNSDTSDATPFAASGCDFSTCPARGSRDTREFTSKFLRTAVFGTAIDRAMEPSLPRSPSQFCAHEDLAHIPRNLRDLRAHTRIFPHHLRAHKTTTSCAQPPSSCAQRFTQVVLARCTVRENATSKPPLFVEPDQCQTTFCSLYSVLCPLSPHARVLSERAYISNRTNRNFLERSTPFETPEHNSALTLIFHFYVNRGVHFTRQTAPFSASLPARDLDSPIPASLRRLSSVNAHLSSRQSPCTNS
jgi:hypothetical protein